MHLRPYSLWAYVRGFNCNTRLMTLFQNQWQHRRDQERRRGVHCPKELARLAYGIIGRIDAQVHNIDGTELRLILNFEDRLGDDDASSQYSMMEEGGSIQ